MPNDPGYNQQWGLQKIRAPLAWNSSQGNGVLVAVVDTGVDLNHKDLRKNIRLRRGRGKNFLLGFRFGSPKDRHGHGTHVSGIIAAVKDNYRGIAGVAPKAKIMPVKGLNAIGRGTTEDLARCIFYAANNRARIISCSFAGDYRGKQKPQTLIDTVRYAYDVRGCIIVAAAANYRTDDYGRPIDNPNADDYYPAAIDKYCREVYRETVDRVITVASINRSGRVSRFSCYGTVVDVAAPGEDILSTYKGKIDRYAYLSGTSMACPHVSGLAALIWAKNPGLSNGQVVHIIRTSTIDIGSERKDVYSGYGYINADRALRATPSQ